MDWMPTCVGMTKLDMAEKYDSIFTVILALIRTRKGLNKKIMMKEKTGGE
jgi:hypothetical protein